VRLDDVVVIDLLDRSDGTNVSGSKSGATSEGFLGADANVSQVGRTSPFGMMTQEAWIEIWSHGRYNQSHPKERQLFVHMDQSLHAGLAKIGPHGFHGEAACYKR
jgi:hypothetical protein